MNNSVSIIFNRSFFRVSGFLTAAIAATLLVSEQAYAQVVCSAANNDLGGFVWRDLDSDGARDAGENGFDGASGPIVVSAYSDSAALGTVNVQPDGSYNFPALFGGGYKRQTRVQRPADLGTKQCTWRKQRDYRAVSLRR